MQATIPTVNDTTDLIDCRECDQSIDRDTLAAYGDLYGPWQWHPQSLARSLERFLRDRPDTTDEMAVAVVVSCWLGYDLEHLARAVRHRIAEEDAS